MEPPEENTGTAGDGKGGGQKKEEKETEVRPIPAEIDRNKDVVRRQGGEVLEENKGEEKKASERPTVGVPARNAEGRPAERIKSGLKPILIRSPWANTSYRGYKNPASNIPTRTITIDGVYYKGDTLYFKVDTHYVSLEQARDMTPYQRDTNKTPHQGDTIYDVSKMKIKVHPDQ